MINNNVIISHSLHTYIELINQIYHKTSKSYHSIIVFISKCSITYLIILKHDKKTYNKHLVSPLQLIHPFIEILVDEPLHKFIITLQLLSSTMYKFTDEDARVHILPLPPAHQGCGTHHTTRTSGHSALHKVLHQVFDTSRTIHRYSQVAGAGFNSRIIFLTQSLLT